MMRVRCGACGSEFEIQGPGRYRCPACQAVNEVRAAPPAGMGGPGMGGPGMGGPGMGGPGMGGPAMGGGLDPFGGGAAPPPPPPETPSPRVTCPDCGFTFIVGDIDVAICPNCRAEVALRPAEEEETGT